MTKNQRPAQQTRVVLDDNGDDRPKLTPGLGREVAEKVFEDYLKTRNQNHE